MPLIFTNNLRRPVRRPIVHHDVLQVRIFLLEDRPHRRLQVLLPVAHRRHHRNPRPLRRRRQHRLLPAQSFNGRGQATLPSLQSSSSKLPTQAEAVLAIVPPNTVSSAPSTSSLMKSTRPICRRASQSSSRITRTRTGAVPLSTTGGLRLLQPVWLPCTTKRFASLLSSPSAAPCISTFQHRFIATCRRSTLLSRGDGSKEITLPCFPTRLEASNVYSP